LALGAAPVLGAGGATAFAITLRVVGFAGELLSAAVAELAALVARDRRPVAAAAAPSSPPAPLDRAGVIVVVPTFNEAEALAVLDARGADLVIGNRYLPGGSTTDWSRSRRALSRVGCTLSKLLLGLPYDDLSGGFKLWRASCLADLDLDATLAAGFAFQIETT